MTSRKQLPLGQQPKRSPKPQAKKAARGRSLLVTVAVLLLLGTHLHVERDGAGTWRVVVDKAAVDVAVLGAVVRRGLGQGVQR